MALTSGQVLTNRYRIVKLIAVGGGGTVYRAWDLNLNAACAVKENLDNSPDAERQFTREATLLAQMRHPYLPRVTDHFTILGQGHYLVMDFIDGEDLETMLHSQGSALPEAQLKPWILQVCDALDYLHHQNPQVIHRDVKPANIRITPQGTAMLVDFGIAKQASNTGPTTTGAKAVSPGYSPPEQYTGTGTDERSDVYALGATIYTLLTGVELKESIHRMIGSTTTQPPHMLRAGVQPQVSKAVMRAINPIPAQRFSSIKEFRAALYGPIGDGTNLPNSGNLLRQLWRKIPQWAWGTIGGILLLIAGLLLLPGLSGKTPGAFSNKPTVVAGITAPVAATKSLLQPASNNGPYFVSSLAGKREIYRLEGSEIIRVTNTPDTFESREPFIISGGTLYFTSNRSGKREIYRLEGNKSTRVTNTPGIAESWQPFVYSDGTIYFTSNREGKREIYRLTGPESVRVTNTPGIAESWDPFVYSDGTIYFTSNREGKREIYRLTGPESVRVTNTPGIAESWDPFVYSDGTIYFTSNREGKREIYRLTGPESVRVTNTPGSAESWDPYFVSGGTLYFNTNRNGNDEIYKLQGDQAMQFVSSPGVVSCSLR